MKLEMEDDDKYPGKMNAHVLRLFNYNGNSLNFNDGLDGFCVTNTISRVDYQREFSSDDQDTKPLMLLNLDNQNKRKASVYCSNYDEEPPYKRSLIRNDEDEEVDLEGWKKKPVEEWERTDTRNWLLCTGEELGHSYGHMSPDLAMLGKELLRLTREDFINYDRFFGEKLYEVLHKMYDMGRDAKSFLPPFDTLKFGSDDETSVGSGNNYSDGESINGVDLIKKRPPGRPRILDPKRKIVKVKLWEFIRNLLLNPKYCPLWICWEDYEKKRFRFVQSDSVAKLWGERKKNKNMTYEKFSRAMRYYYTKRIFVAVPGRRLVYEFGEKATGLETENPNFDPNYYRGVVRQRL